MEIIGDKAGERVNMERETKNYDPYNVQYCFLRHL